MVITDSAAKERIIRSIALLMQSSSMTPQHFVRSMLLVVICIASCAMQAQSPVQPPANDHPGMLGTLEQGRYSNHMIGFSIQLDKDCAIVNEAGAIEWVHKFPQRLTLSIRCTD